MFLSTILRGALRKKIFPKVKTLTEQWGGGGRTSAELFCIKKYIEVQPIFGTRGVGKMKV